MVGAGDDHKTGCWPGRTGPAETAAPD